MELLYVGFTSDLIEGEHAEILSINPLYPPVLGDFEAGGHPQTPSSKYPAPLFQRSQRIWEHKNKAMKGFTKKYNRRWKKRIQNGEICMLT